MKNIILIGYLIGSIITLSGDFDEGISTRSIPPQSSQQQFKLQTVNSISLYDNPNSVIAKIGEPKSITRDEHFMDVHIYHYPGMNITFSDEMLDFVEILEEADTLLIDDVPISATIEDLKAALGEPDYVTEDGIVFERDEALLKLFLNAESSQLISINYFHRGTE